MELLFLWQFEICPATLIFGSDFHFCAVAARLSFVYCNIGHQQKLNIEKVSIWYIINLRHHRQWMNALLLRQDYDIAGCFCCRCETVLTGGSHRDTLQVWASYLLPSHRRRTKSRNVEFAACRLLSWQNDCIKFPRSDIRRPPPRCYAAKMILPAWITFAITRWVLTLSI